MHHFFLDPIFVLLYRSHYYLSVWFYIWYVLVICIVCSNTTFSVGVLKSYKNLKQRFLLSMKYPSIKVWLNYPWNTNHFRWIYISLSRSININLLISHLYMFNLKLWRMRFRVVFSPHKLRVLVYLAIFVFFRCKRLHRQLLSIRDYV